MVGVAQLVERRIVIPVVVGSSPIVHPICPFLIADFLSVAPTISATSHFQASLPADILATVAKVAELVDALVLGTSVARRESSSLSFRTIFHGYTSLLTRF